jgi:hypothetical protein
LSSLNFSSLGGQSGFLFSLLCLSGFLSLLLFFLCDFASFDLLLECFQTCCRSLTLFNDFSFLSRGIVPEIR